MIFESQRNPELILNIMRLTEWYKNYYIDGVMRCCEGDWLHYDTITDSFYERIINCQWIYNIIKKCLLCYKFIKHLNYTKKVDTKLHEAMRIMIMFYWAHKDHPTSIVPILAHIPPPNLRRCSAVAETQHVGSLNARPPTNTPPGIKTTNLAR